MLRSMTAHPRIGGTVTALPLPPPATGPEPARSYAVPIFAFLALLVVGILFGLTQVQQGGSIAALPAGARAQLFRDSLAEVQSTCLEPYAARGSLRDHCVEQARFVLRFPECGPECRRAANAVLPHAHR